MISICLSTLWFYNFNYFTFILLTRFSPNPILKINMFDVANLVITLNTVN